MHPNGKLYHSQTATSNQAQSLETSSELNELSTAFSVYECLHLSIHSVHSWFRRQKAPLPGRNAEAPQHKSPLCSCPVYLPSIITIENRPTKWLLLSYHGQANEYISLLAVNYYGLKSHNNMIASESSRLGKQTQSVASYNHRTSIKTCLNCILTS